MAGPIHPLLLARRQHLKLTQHGIAQRSGLDQSSYSKIENGTTDPRLSTLLDIARAMSLQVMLIPDEIASTVHALIAESGSESPPLFEATGE